MKILFIASDNNFASGAFLSMCKLNQLLNNKLNIQTFVVLPNEGDGNVILEEYRIPYKIIPSRNWIIDIEEGKEEENSRRKEKELKGNICAIEEIAKVIKEEQIEIVHINTSYSYVGAEAALKTNTPFIWHLREFLEEDQHRKIWNRKKGYALMSKASCIVAISNSIKAKYENVFPKNKLKCIYNGIDENIFYMPEREILKKSKIQGALIGGIVPHKGQMELIKALAGIDDRWKFEVVLVGKGKAENIEKVNTLIKEEKLIHKIKVLDATHDIASILEKTDIAFVCSRNEAFGRVTVEAMMAGCVVIGADTAGTAEILNNGENGILYKKGNIQDLAKKIKWVFENREKARKIAKKGQYYALKHYTAIRNAEQIAEMYYEIVKQRENNYGKRQ